MTLQDILTAKGSRVYTTDPSASLAEVVRRLVEHRVGSLVVCQPGGPEAERLLGIITERDILFYERLHPGLADLIPLHLRPIDFHA